MDKGSASKWAAAGAANHDSSWYSGSAPECSGIRCVLKAAICRPFDLSGVFATAAGRIAEAWLTLEQTMEPLNLARVNSRQTACFCQYRVSCSVCLVRMRREEKYEPATRPLKSSNFKASHPPAGAVSL